jgi:hypothetical protein
MTKTTSPTPSPTEAALTAANTKMAELRNKLATVQADLESAHSASALPTRVSALALLDGSPDDAEPVYDLDDLLRQEAAIREAENILGQRIQSLDSQVVAARYAIAKSEHADLIESLVVAFEKLCDAMRAEWKFRHQFTTLGGRPIAAAPNLKSLPWLDKLRSQPVGQFRHTQIQRGFSIPGPSLARKVL